MINCLSSNLNLFIFLIIGLVEHSLEARVTCQSMSREKKKNIGDDAATAQLADDLP